MIIGKSVPQSTRAHYRFDYLYRLRANNKMVEMQSIELKF